MNTIDIENYNKRYNKRLEEFGYDPRTLGWGGGKERQHLRFKVLAEIGIQSHDSVLDVGCGFGDLFEYLKENGWDGKYLGTDINTNLLDIAKEKHTGITVEKIDILAEDRKLNFDWVISSGIFNAKLISEDNSVYIQKMVKRMFAIANCGIACDFLSTYVDFQHPEAFHTDPKWVIDFTKLLAAKIVLRMDYLPYEFCVYLKK
jgi:SAM-dependent methyltransferase